MLKINEFTYEIEEKDIKDKFARSNKNDKEGIIMKEVVLKIKGMHCEGCSTRLEKVLNNQDGVEEANVSLEDAKADVKYDENQIGLDELKEAIEDAGFEAE